jgi:hypothetical protein
VVAISAAGLAANWKEAMAMPIDLATSLIGAKLRMAAAATGTAATESGPLVTNLPGGGQEIRFTDIQQLAAALPASYFGGRSQGK